jgi:hypothetical protein
MVSSSCNLSSKAHIISSLIKYKENMFFYFETLTAVILTKHDCSEPPFAKGLGCFMPFYYHLPESKTLCGVLEIIESFF